jgi:predicted DNA-binding transcriptional regulator AlpA
MEHPDTAARQSSTTSPDVGDRLLKQAEVQKILGNVDRGTIFRWRKSGLLPQPRVIAGRPYWRKSDIQAFIARVE